MATVSRLAKRYLFVSIGSLALATTQAAYGQEPADEIAEVEGSLHILTGGDVRENPVKRREIGVDV